MGRKAAANVLAGLLALLVWQGAAFLVNNRLLLVGPVQVAQRLWQLAMQPDFWQAVGFTLSRIALGFFLGSVTALVLACFCAGFPLAEVLLRPYLAAAQTVPVASFIVIALLWLSGRRLSVFISFLMVLPVMYSNLLRGIQETDADLLEMAGQFRIPMHRRIRGIYVPAVRPYALSAAHVALGLCWKAGVAAEVIGVCTGSVGGMLYEAKVYLEISDLFAWTLVIVLLSWGFEFLVTKGLEWLLNRLEDV